MPEYLKPFYDWLPEWLRWIVGPWVLILPLYGYFYYIWPEHFPAFSDVEKRLDDTFDRNKIKTELESPAPWLERYRAAITWLNGRFDGFFGAGLWSWKAFDRLLAFALIYPIALFILGWLCGGTGKIGTLDVLPEVNLRRRLVIVATIAGLGTFYYWVFTRDITERVGAWVNGLIRRHFPAWPNWIGDLAGLLAVGGVGVVGVVGVVVGGVVGGGVVGVGVVGVVGGVVGVGGVGGVVGVVVVVVVVVVGGVGVVVGGVGVVVGGVGGVVGGVNTQLDNENSNIAISTMLIFYFILPIVNAILDYLSWGATRYFLKKANPHHKQATQAFWLTFHLVADFAIAVFCLFALAFLTGLVLEGASLFLEKRGAPPLHWPEMFISAINDPIPSGLMLIGMLVTTLIPTLIHLIVGLSAILAVATPGTHAIAAEIGDSMSPLVRQKVAAYYLRRKWWTFVPAAALSLSLMGAVSYVIFTAEGATIARDRVAGSSYYLMGTALCGGAVVRGECPLWRSKAPAAIPVRTPDTPPART